jgi:hypothetical protein
MQASASGICGQQFMQVESRRRFRTLLLGMLAVRTACLSRSGQA